MPPSRTVSGTLRAAIALSPAVVLGAFALIPLVVLSADNRGFFPDKWYPAAIFLLALATVGLFALPSGGRPPLLVLIAAGALLAYAGWSYLSISWADQRADAWDGANRTALYAVLFALFALWRIRGRAAVALVGAFALAVAAIGLEELLTAAAADDPGDRFIDGRLATPVGYANGNAALWSAAFWPCVVLASRRETIPLLRAAFAGSAVLLGGLALMGQSRGWLFALPVVLLLFLAFTPQRVRTTFTLALIAGAVALTLPAVLDVYDVAGPELADALDGARNSILALAALAAAVAGLAGLPDRHVRVPRVVERRAGLALGFVAAGVVAFGSIVYVAERGNPASDVADAWDEFKNTGTPAGGESRFGTRLGSNRYDFWQVAWNEFADAPLRGIGADNFQQAYLAQGESGEQPRYPHSVELRTLSQTGLVGAALLLVAIGAALASALRALRLRSGPGRAAAAAGLAAFTYWLVHGSVDWFWEIPALGGAAFALLGLAAGLAPRPATLRPGARRRPLAAGAGAAVAAVAALALAASFGGPLLAERYTDQALDLWTTDADRAFDKLDRAAALNPLSPDPDYAAGSIALRLDRFEQAEASFRSAIEREPGDSSSHLELGAVLFNEGERAEGIRHLRRAVQLDPNDEIIRGALRRARRGREIDIEAMNQAIAERYRELGE